MMDVELLKSRVTELERLVLGHTMMSPSQKPKHTIAEIISDAQKQIALAEKRPKIKEILSQSSEISKYMDPHYVDDLTLSNAAKAKVILSQEAEIVKTAQALETLQLLKDVLNHPAYSDLSAMKVQFANMLQKHSEQETESADFLDESNQLLRTYMETMRDLSKLLVAWQTKVKAK